MPLSLRYDNTILPILSLGPRVGHTKSSGGVPRPAYSVSIDARGNERYGPGPFGPGPLGHPGTGHATPRLTTKVSSPTMTTFQQPCWRPRVRLRLPVPLVRFSPHDGSNVMLTISLNSSMTDREKPYRAHLLVVLHLRRRVRPRHLLLPDDPVSLRS
jgi:hypothetical protein